MVTCAALRVKRSLWHRCGMARDDLHFRLRIPETLKDLIEKAAAANNRSMTAEIVSRLDRSFEIQDEWKNAIDNISDALLRIERLERDVADLNHATGRRDYAGNDK